MDIHLVVKLEILSGHIVFSVTMRDVHVLFITIDEC